MRDHSHHIEMSRGEAVSAMLERWDWKAASRDCVDIVPIAQSYGRVLAEDVRSRIEAPNALTCCMDSIAVHYDDFANGMPDTSAWVRGVDWQFANTGIAMPEGFDAAIVIEHVTVSPDEQHVEIDAAPSARFAGTRPAGSNLHEGDLLGKAGEVITPDVAARLSSGNYCAVPVVARPRVAFIPTGNELVRPGGFIERGKTLETNSVVVRGKIEAWGGIPQIFDIVPDKPGLIESAVREGVRTADIVVVNAGSSKGSEDWSCEKLEEMGEIICHETNHGPGHHSWYAVVDGKPVVGISGPSGGASFTLNFYLRPLMRAWLGLEPEVPRLPARLAAPFPTKKGHAGTGESGKKATAGVGGSDAKPALSGETRPSVVRDGQVFYGIKFLTVALSADGVLEATPIPGRPGSPETQHANAYYMLPSGPGIETPQVGDIIEVELR